MRIKYLLLTTAALSDLEISAGQTPVITSQPTNQTVSLGGGATFSAEANGDPTPDWVWRLNGRLLGKGNSYSYGDGLVHTGLSVQDAKLSDAGNYTIVFSNSFGVVTSAVAVLTIREQAPVITIPPSHQTAFIGEDVTFLAEAIGNPAPDYQWRFIRETTNSIVNSSALPGGTNSLLNLFHVTSNDTGNYTVVASNYLGSVTSSVANLAVVRRGPLDDWQWRNPLPKGNHLRGVTYGNGLLVAVGFSGTLLTSPDAGELEHHPSRPLAQFLVRRLRQRYFCSGWSQRCSPYVKRWGEVGPPGFRQYQFFFWCCLRERFVCCRFRSVGHC